MERLTANGRFEEVFIGAKEGLERLWLEQMPFPFLVAGCVVWILVGMVVVVGEGGRMAPTHSVITLTKLTQPNPIQRAGSSRPRTGCGCWRSCCR